MTAIFSAQLSSYTNDTLTTVKTGSSTCQVTNIIIANDSTSDITVRLEQNGVVILPAELIGAKSSIILNRTIHLTTGDLQISCSGSGISITVSGVE